VASIKTKADAYAARMLPMVRDIQARLGAATLRDIAAELTARGIETARGGTVWHASQVSNLLARA
jgi:hypothetical protein